MIRYNNNSHNTTTSVVVGGGNNNSRSRSNCNNVNTSKRQVHVHIGGHKRQMSAGTTVVKYSRIVCLLTFVFVVCGLFLILSPMFLVPKSTSTSTQTSSVWVHDSSTNTFFEPPIMIRNNKNSNNNNNNGNGNGNEVVSTLSANAGSDNNATASFYHVPPDDNTHNVKQSLSWEALNQYSVYSKSRTQQPPQQVPTHLPLPIFVMNMPKSGSTTIHQYFVCGMGKIYSVHNVYNKRQMDPHEGDYIHPDLQFAATCMGHNYIMDKPLIQGCGGFPVWTDSGAVVWDRVGDENRLLDSKYDDYGATTQNQQRPIAITKKENKKRLQRSWCFYPGVHALENIAKYYPYATILHLPRNSTDWVRSSKGWSPSMVDMRDGKNSNVSNGSQQHPQNKKIEIKNGSSEKTILDRYEIKCNGFDQNEFIVPPTTMNRRGEEKIPGMNVGRGGGGEEKLHTGNNTNNKTKTSPKKIYIRKTDNEWMEWYDTKYTQRIRDFATHHPTLTYFESKLEDPQTPKRLEKATGIAASCFGHNLKTADLQGIGKRRKEDIEKEKRKVQRKEKNAKNNDK